jgi:AcrR family transcriptional regulator
MERTPRTVKGSRTYDASGRQARARAQHDATLDAAAERFLEHGYAATTVESIAHAAGVSTATIYKSYGGKAGLVRELCARALRGSGPVPAEERSNALRSQVDARGLIEGWGQLVAEIAPRAAPLLLLLKTAAQDDAEAAALHAELDRARLARMADNARHLLAAGPVREEVTVREARDVMWLVTAPELYDLLVVQRRWSVSRFARFVTETMVAALL